jgi:hypothetical protein
MIDYKAEEILRRPLLGISFMRRYNIPSAINYGLYKNRQKKELHPSAFRRSMFYLGHFLLLWYCSKGNKQTNKQTARKKCFEKIIRTLTLVL